MSSPSRKRLIPTSTSKTPARKSRIISTRSTVSTSECKYRTLTWCSSRYCVSSSAIFLVSVVIKTRSCFLTRSRISSSTSSTCVVAGRTSNSGSTKPVGRTTCSTICELFSSSYSAGVAETKMLRRILRSNSSNRSGRLSKAEGSRNPYSTRVSLRERSPRYIACNCPIKTWLSSKNIRASGGR